MKCGKTSPTPGYEPCSREEHEDGPCAHERRVSTDPLMYVFLRSDLAMPPGKAAAQACHAVHRVVRRFERLPHLIETKADREQRGLYDEWDEGSWAKCVLAVASDEAMAALEKTLDEHKLAYEVVVDEGRTCVAPGSRTALAVEPVGRALGRALFRGYSLY